MRIGNWEIVSQIGNGRWSKVALAKPSGCHSNSADYVIKYIEPDSDYFEFAQKMLIREFACSKLLNHASIVSYLDGDPLHSIPYLVSARHPGETLQKVNAHLSLIIELQDKLTCFRQISEAVAEIHRLGIRHGDLSPSNIILDVENSRTLLLDLGLSEKVDPFHRSVDCIAGTWGYVAPECIQGSMPVNLSADVYSLGITMSEFFSQQRIKTKTTTSYSPIRNSLFELLDAMSNLHPLKRPEIREVVQKISWLEIGCLNLDYPAAA